MKLHGKILDFQGEATLCSECASACRCLAYALWRIRLVYTGFVVIGEGDAGLGVVVGGVEARSGGDGVLGLGLWFGSVSFGRYGGLRMV